MPRRSGFLIAGLLFTLAVSTLGRGAQPETAALPNPF
jgi:hypothetical protein